MRPSTARKVRRNWRLPRVFLGRSASRQSVPLSPLLLFPPPSSSSSFFTSLLFGLHPTRLLLSSIPAFLRSSFTRPLACRLANPSSSHSLLLVTISGNHEGLHHHHASFRQNRFHNQITLKSASLAPSAVAAYIRHSRHGQR